MINFSDKVWSEILKGYKGKATIDGRAVKNMAAFTGDVHSSTYLPRYSSREDENDYKERLARSEINYFNFPRKVLNIWGNAIFRSAEPNRTTKSKFIENRFWKNVDGGGTAIGDFVREQIYTLMTVDGGCLAIVDKPPIPASEEPVSLQQQEELNLFPYVWTARWKTMVNYSADRHGALEWILLDVTQPYGKKEYLFFDKTSYAVVDEKMKVVDDNSGEHELGIVPVVRIFDERNPEHRFQTPLSSITEIANISLKVFQLLSQLDQMIIAHVFLKVAMPEGMFNKIKAAGMGTFNALIYPDQFSGQQAHYLDMPQSEINTLVNLIFEQYPRMVLDLANIVDKTDRPREESGTAKQADSRDELSNLEKKAGKLEMAENELTKIAAAWQQEKNPGSVVYHKNFDVASLHEQLEQMIQIFKQDMQAPMMAKEITKRVARKMLGNIEDDLWKQIAEEIDSSIDPSLDTNDMQTLINLGIIKLENLVRRYNPQLAKMSDEEARKFVSENLAALRGVSEVETDLIQ